MIKETEDGILLGFKISPNGSKNEIIHNGDEIKIKITAQPIDGKANKALTEFLSKHLKVPKTSIEIVKGQTSKDKILFIRAAESKRKEILEKLKINLSEKVSR